MNGLESYASTFGTNKLHITKYKVDSIYLQSKKMALIHLVSNPTPLVFVIPLKLKEGDMFKEKLKKLEPSVENFLQNKFLKYIVAK